MGDPGKNNQKCTFIIIWKVCLCQGQATLKILNLISPIFQAAGKITFQGHSQSTRDEPSMPPRLSFASKEFIFLKFLKKLLVKKFLAVIPQLSPASKQKPLGTFYFNCKHCKTTFHLFHLYKRILFFIFVLIFFVFSYEKKKQKEKIS